MGFDLKQFLEQLAKERFMHPRDVEYIIDVLHPAVISMIIKMHDRLHGKDDRELSKGMGVSAECSVLEQQLAKYSENLNIERIKVDMLERKVDIAVEALGNAYHVSINESDWSVRKTITEALEKLKENK